MADLRNAHMRRPIERPIRFAVKAASAAIDLFASPLTGPRILIYHQVGTQLGREMEVSSGDFKRHIDWMEAYGEVVDLESAIERRSEPRADQLFVLTFDDGFADVYHNAFPLMRDRAIPFTLYLTTQPIESGQPLNPMFPTALPLNWDQVNEMAGTGLLTLGAHTDTHVDFTRASATRIEAELDRSNATIERETGRMPKHFTYPWGWWSETADPLVRERYQSATVGSPSPVDADSDLMTLGRYPVQLSDGAAWLPYRLRRGFHLEAAIRRRRAGYTGP